jgi:hypothetical protein
MPYWNISLNDAPLDLDHLEPLGLKCPCESIGRDLRIDVMFTNHCFTVAFDEGVHEDAVRIMDHKQARAFDQQRYEHSRLLPAIVNALPDSKVHQTPEFRNYVYYGQAPLGDGRALQMFFRIKRSKRPGYDLDVVIESAYVANELASRKRPNAIRFRILALKVLRGEKIRFAPR